MVKAPVVWLRVTIIICSCVIYFIASVSMMVHALSAAKSSRKTQSAYYDYHNVEADLISRYAAQFWSWTDHNESSRFFCSISAMVNASELWNSRRASDKKIPSHGLYQYTPIVQIITLFPDNAYNLIRYLVNLRFSRLSVVKISVYFGVPQSFETWCG